MNQTFEQALNEWTAFYALMGGAAATLLGLLFVALSMRLNIFHQRNVADVRDFAALTFGNFLVTLVGAGLALSPHERHGPLARLLLAVGIIGVLAVAVIVRTWVGLNRPVTAIGLGFTRDAGRSLVIMLGMAGPYPGLILVAVLMVQAHPDALGWLAVVEGWLLVVGTLGAWLMLSHAGNTENAGNAGDNISE